MHGVQLRDDSLAHGLFDEGTEADNELEAADEVQDVHAVGRDLVNLGVLAGSYAVGAEAFLQDKVVHLINYDLGALELSIGHAEELLDKELLRCSKVRDL